ncbi:hypothetical protein ACJX0J_042137, partial [Zea mays]
LHCATARHVPVDAVAPCHRQDLMASRTRSLPSLLSLSRHPPLAPTPKSHSRWRRSCASSWPSTTDQPSSKKNAKGNKPRKERNIIFEGFRTPREAIE